MDIVVVRRAGDAVTVGVKGVAKKWDWPANNLVTDNPNRHFVALVGFEGLIDDPRMSPPRVWILPFERIEYFKRFYSGRTNVSRAAICAEATEFEHAWHLIEGNSPTVSGEGAA